MNELATVFLGAIAGGLIGGGAIITLLWNAAENRLRKTFATRENLDGLGSRVNALETVAVGARDRADEAMDRVAILEERQQQQWERVTEQIIRPLERVADRMEQLGQEQARQSEALRNLYERLRT